MKEDPQMPLNNSDKQKGKNVLSPPLNPTKIEADHDEFQKIFFTEKPKGLHFLLEKFIFIIRLRSSPSRWFQLEPSLVSEHGRANSQ